MAASIDFSGLPSKMADYALADNSAILTKTLVDDMAFTKYMQMLVGNDEIPLTELVVDDVLQPGGKDAFNPKAAVNFKARIGKVRPCKVDLLFTPSKILQFWKTYLGKVKQGTPSSPYDMPFQEFIFAQVIKKLKENLRLKAIFQGVYNPTGTGAADTMDGLVTLIRAAITAGSIPAGNITAYTAITAINAVDEFNKLAEKVIANPAYGSAKMICLVSPIIHHYYNQAYKAENGSLPYNNQFNQTKLEGSNIWIQEEPGLSGITTPFITPEENLFYLVDDEARQDSIIVEKEKRNINVMMDFQASVDFGIAELIWTMNAPS